MTDAPQKLVAPPEFDQVQNAIENCKSMIEDGIDDILAIHNGKSVKRPSYRSKDYDEGYAQGRKDASRVVLVTLTGQEHVNSFDVQMEREKKRRGDQ